jgi:hypothetical protein
VANACVIVNKTDYLQRASDNIEVVRLLLNPSSETLRLAVRLACVHADIVRVLLELPLKYDVHPEAQNNLHF